MNQFISCDWGTTSLRLRLIENETQNILAEVISQQGIAATYTLWKNSSSERFLFYRNILSAGIKEFSSQCAYSLHEIPIIISGMASSGIGMMELEYEVLPVKTDGSDLLTKSIEPADDFGHQMIFISGVRSSNDVMRGEETIIAGCGIEKNHEEDLFILPGTHSKHIIIQNSRITNIKTFMTGELFDLLSTKSILSSSVEKENLPVEIINSYFINGIKDSADNNLLNSIFRVRTNSLFNKLSPKENYHYLSGLLIGAELKELLHKNYSTITLVSDGKFLPLYSQALHILGIDKSIHNISADMALIKGQTIIYKLLH